MSPIIPSGPWTIMIPTQIIEFLGMKINSKAMTISLPDEKIQTSD